MTKSTLLIAFIVVMIAIIVGVDVLFFRNQFWERLLANLGIVLVCLALYMRFFQ